jgi:hypothetical protein
VQQNSKGRVTPINTREIALVSVFSATWIMAEIYLGPIIGQTTGIHGVPDRLFGWLLMVILAELTGEFGNVSVMSAVAALATRAIPRSSSLESIFVGLGYVLGGLVFDFLFFHLFLKGKIGKLYALSLSVVSGVAASIPYLLLRVFLLTPVAFVIWIPIYAPNFVIEITLGALGTLIGLSIVPLIRPSKLEDTNRCSR